MFNNKATLITMATTVNTYGDPLETVSTSKVVFCRVASADEKEKALAESRGQNAELVIIIPDKSMYGGQTAIKIDETQFRVTDRKFSDASKELRLVVGRWETH